MWNENITQDFPILQQRVHGKRFVYLDSSATTQKPKAVIDVLQNYYQQHNANIHRGVYELSVRATDLYEKTRAHIKEHINAKNSDEIIFVRGTTEGINLVAQTYGKSQLKSGDEIIISTMEHHSNIVPWQMLCEQIGTVLRVIPISDDGEIDLDDFRKLFSARTKLVAITHASNVLGTINPIKKIVAIAHEQGAAVLVDGAQAFPHLKIDMQDLDCDFYVFSAHKAYGPTGLGVLYGKKALLNSMPPYQGGGDMIEKVSFAKTTYSQSPRKFEAGTPNIAGVIAFDAALTYLNQIGTENLVQHENELMRYANAKLAEFPNIKIIGKAKEKVGVISLVFSDIHPHDIGTILDHEGIAVRAGHHCAMPLMERYQVPATLRLSFGLYNTKEDVDAFIAGLQQVKRIFS